MPEFFNRILWRQEKNTLPVNRYEGFTETGAVILRDCRNTRRAGIPDAETKSAPMGDDPLAIYKPTGASSSTPQRRWATSRGRTYAADNAVASEVGNTSSEGHQELDGR